MGATVQGSHVIFDQLFKAFHHYRGECHWAVVIKAGWSCSLGYRNDGGLPEACGYDRLSQ